ncbi:MAG: sigma-70 family RNA polymerase sigma factor [Nibricoccus sp.]
MTPDDTELLRRYVREGAEDAFRELVQRYIGVVYHAALRQTGDARRAEDVAQEVFTLLAKKALVLEEHPVLIGWLFSTTRRVSWKMMRAERRRREREYWAQLDMEEDASSSRDWERLKPVLDAVLNQLKPAERDALLLRYFEEQTFVEMGRRFGVSEDAARMRVDRALQKLRGRLVKRGIASTAGALATLLASHAVGATPSGLASSVSATALSQSVTGGFFAMLAKLVLMTKTQTAILCGLATLLMMGAVWQRQKDREVELSVAIEGGRGEELQAALKQIELQITQLQGTRPLPVQTTLTPEQQEKKRESLLTNRKLFDPRYAALYRHLHLAPSDLEKLKDLLAERGWDQTVELSFARKNGLAEMRNIETRLVMAAASVEVNARIRALLGETSYAYFERYDRSSVLRNLFSRFTEELEYLGVPMSDEQMDLFTDLAYVHMRDGLDRWREGGGPQISAEMSEKAATFMTPRQLERLKAAQEEFDARLKISAMNRAAAEQGRVIVTQHTAKYYPKCPVDDRD